jgi:hypothetical protein
LLEQRLAKRLGGLPQDHTRLALSLWALMHGATTLLLSASIPDGHEEELREAYRAAIKTLLGRPERFGGKSGRKQQRRSEP